VTALVGTIHLGLLSYSLSFLCECVCVCQMRNEIRTRPVLDWFQDSSKTSSGINFLPTFLAAFFTAFFCHDFFWPTFFWHALLSTQYKRLAILSMQYKNLLPFLGVRGWEVVCV